MGGPTTERVLPVAPIALCISVLLALWFFPFIFRGEHAVPFHFLPRWESGLQGGPPWTPLQARLEERRFPGSDSSPVVLHYPNAVFAAQCIRSGTLPLWNPYIGCGTPALASGQVAVFSPFLLPVYLHPSPWTYTLGLVLGTLWCALGGWCWLRRFGWHPWITAFGASLWAFNPWTVRIDIFSSVWAAWWFGWLLWSWDRLLAAPRRLFWLPPVMMAGMVYGGHPETAAMLAGGSILYALVMWSLAASKGHAPRARSFAGATAASLLLVLALTAVHWLPLASYVRESASYKSAERAPAQTIQYEGGAFFDPSSEIFIAPLLLCMVAVGAAGIRKRLDLLPSLLLGAAGAFLVADLLYAGWLPAHLPFVRLIPLKYYRSLLWFGLIPLAAAGANEIVGAGFARRGMRLRFAALWGGGLLAWWLGRVLAGFDLPRGASAAVFAADLAIWALVASAALLGRRVLLSTAVGAILLFLVEPLAFQRFDYPYFNRMDPRGPKVPGVEEALEVSAAGHGRFTGDFPWPMVATPNLSTLWRARDVRMNGPLQMERYARLNWICSPPELRFVGTWAAMAGVPPSMGRAMGLQIRLHLDSNLTGAVAVKVEEPTERAFMVSRIVRTRSEQESERAVAARLLTADWLAGAVVESPAPLAAPFGVLEAPSPDPSRPAGQVRWLTDGVDEASLSCSCASPSVLVLTDAYAQGWRATLDGHDVEIYPADLAFRAVLVPPGEHVIRMAYRPQPVYIGLALSAAAWLLVILCALASRGRARLSESGGP